MSWLRTFLLMAVMTLLLMLVGSVVAGRGGALVALVLAGAMNVWAWWASDTLVLHRYRAQEIGPGHPSRLHEIVADLAREAGLPMPRVYIIPSETPNAFATGRDPRHAAVAATEGLLRLLDERELRGVMAHELTHVGKRDILTQSVAATLAGAIGYLAFGARLRALFGDRREGASPVAVLLIAVLAPLAALIIQAALSRTREFAADEGGARIARDGEGLASALEKLSAGVARRPLGDEAATTAHLFIVSPLAPSGLANLFSTHPPVEERVARLRGARA